MAYVNVTCAGCVTIFSTGGKFRSVQILCSYTALTLAARSYALLLGIGFEEDEKMSLSV